jgi:hypothetical protein
MEVTKPALACATAGFAAHLRCSADKAAFGPTRMATVLRRRSRILSVLAGVYAAIFGLAVPIRTYQMISVLRAVAGPITRLSVKGRALVVENARGETFELDLDSGLCRSVVKKSKRTAVATAPSDEGGVRPPQ